MDPLKITKEVVGFVVGAGVSKIVADVVANNVTQNTKLQKIVVYAGRIGIGMIVSEVVRAHVDKRIDDTAANIKKFKNGLS